MAKQLKLRRGTTSQHSSFTGAEGEVTVDTDKETLVVHDGSTAGGHPLVKENAEVTSTGIASNVVDEDNLKISNSGTDGQYLQKQSGNTGGLTWADVAAGGGTLTATASGSIANGAAVYKKSDGTVSAITNERVQITPELGQVSHFLPLTETSGGTTVDYVYAVDVDIAYDATTQCVVVGFTANNNTDTGAANTYYKDVYTVVGKVSGKGKDCSIDWGTPQLIYDGSTDEGDNLTLDSIGGGKVVIGWKRRTANTFDVVVGTISSTNKNLTLGTAVSNSDVTWGWDQRVKGFGTDKFIMLAGSGSQYDRHDAKIIVGTVSGTTITLGTIADASPATHDVGHIEVDVANNKVFLSAEEVDGSYYYPTFRCGTISGTTITWGSWTRYTGYPFDGTQSGVRNYYQSPMTWDTENSRLTVFVRDSKWENGSNNPDGFDLDGNPYTGLVSQGERLKGITIQVSGTTLTVDSSPTVFPERVRDYDGFHSSSGYPYGTSWYLNMGTTSNLYDPDLKATISFANLQSEDYISYYPWRQLAGSSTPVIWSTKASGSTLTKSKEILVRGVTQQPHDKNLPPYNAYGSGLNTQYAAAAYDTVNKQVLVVAAGTGGFSQAGHQSNKFAESFVVPFVMSDVTTTAKEFVGFAEAAYTNGQTATITTPGGINESQSGLTVGSSYFVQGDGTLSVTPDADYGPIFAGIATAATKLVVGQNTSVDHTGDITSQGDGKTTISDNVISASKFKTSNIPTRSGLVLRTDGFTNLADEQTAPLAGLPATNYQPNDLVWAAPDVELVGGCRDESGITAHVFDRMMDTAYWTNKGAISSTKVFIKTFYRVLWKARFKSDSDSSSSSNRKVRISVLAGNGSGIIGNYSGGVGAYNQQYRITAGSTDTNVVGNEVEFWDISPESAEVHYGEFHFPSWHSEQDFNLIKFDTMSYKGMTTDNSNNSYMKTINGTGCLAGWKGGNWNLAGFQISTPETTGFEELSYRVYAMR